MITAEEASRTASAIGAENKLEMVLSNIVSHSNKGDYKIVFGNDFISSVVEEKLLALGYKIKREHALICISW